MTTILLTLAALGTSDLSCDCIPQEILLEAEKDILTRIRASKYFRQQERMNRARETVTCLKRVRILFLLI